MPLKPRTAQELVAAQTAMIQFPLSLLSVLEDTQSAFFGLCVDAGQQVLGALMEADRTALCGLAAKALRKAIRVQFR